MPIIGPDVRPAPPPFFTRSQVKVSETMARHVRQHKTDFLVNVGDNFYLCGVPNLENIRFEVPNFLRYLRPQIVGLDAHSFSLLAESYNLNKPKKLSRLVTFIFCD